MPASLSARLREETRALHTAAERSGIMRAVLRGTVGRDAYAPLLRALHAIYAALEQGLTDCAASPAVGPLARPELFRAARLERDLDALAGDAWRATLPVPDAARAYADRLARHAASEPALLVAHAYVRYLGDLSGGQHIKRIVRRSLALDGVRGTAFYEFPEIADADAYKAGYRAALDALPVGAAAAGRIVDEAKWAFAAHAELFEALDGTD